MTFDLCMAVVSHVLDENSENFHRHHNKDNDDDHGDHDDHDHHQHHHDDHDDDHGDHDDPDHDHDNGHDDEGGDISFHVSSELQDSDSTLSLLDLMVGRQLLSYGDLGLWDLSEEHDGLTMGSSCSDAACRVLCTYGDYHHRNSDSGHDDEGGDTSLHVSSEVQDSDVTLSLLDLMVGRQLLLYGDLGLWDLPEEHDGLTMGSSCSKHDDLGGEGCPKHDTTRITLYGACLFFPRVGYVVIVGLCWVFFL